jgi:phytoene synthase
MQESRTITRRSASNLALAFVLLPKHKRDGMSALYAFCREVDDAADDESLPVDRRREILATWRADIARACAGRRSATSHQSGVAAIHPSTRPALWPFR